MSLKHCLYSLKKKEDRKVKGVNKQITHIQSRNLNCHVNAKYKKIYNTFMTKLEEQNLSKKFLFVQKPPKNY
jgi:hypothetical protein